MESLPAIRRLQVGESNWPAGKPHPGADVNEFVASSWLAEKRSARSPRCAIAPGAQNLRSAGRS